VNKRLIDKYFYNPTEKQSLSVLIISILASLGVYFGMIVRYTPLVQYEKIPHYDLLAMIKADPETQARLISAFILLAIFYLLGWWASRKIPHRHLAWALVLAGIAAASFVLLYLYPFDAADIFDNISHGRILCIYQANPFLLVSASFPKDPFHDFPAWGSTPSAYGPLWEDMAAITARLAGNGMFQNIMAFKLLPGLFLFVSIALTGRLIQKVDPKRALSAVWLLGMNPIILYETFGHGHNDIAMVVWMIAAVVATEYRHFTMAILALVAGGLVKYIAFLLIPVAGLMALYELPDMRERIRFVIVTAVVTGILVVGAYAHFWYGWETLTIERRTQLFTTSLPSIIYSFLRLRIGFKPAAAWVSEISAATIVIFTLWQAVRATQNKTDPVWQRFCRAGVHILLFYMLVAILWFHQWYMVWAISLAILLPYEPVRTMTLFDGFAVLSKPFIMSPLLFIHMPSLPHEWLELRLSVGVLALPWLAAIMTLLWLQIRKGRSASLPDPQSKVNFSESHKTSPTGT
jgi:hypothetical protein